MLAKVIKDKWGALPNLVKDRLYNLAYLYSERSPVRCECLDKATDAVFDLTESESDWYRINLEGALEDIEGGRVTKVPTGMRLSDWLNSILDEVGDANYGGHEAHGCNTHDGPDWGDSGDWCDGGDCGSD